MKNTELDFDWSCLPAWAKYIAMDSNSYWWWYRDKPLINNYGGPYMCWTADRCYDKIPNEYAPKNFTGDWKDSLFEVSK